MWDLARGFCQRSLVCHSSVNSVRVSLDGSLAVSGHFDGTLRFWDLRSARVANEVAGLHTQQITSVAVGLATGAQGRACCEAAWLTRHARNMAFASQPAGPMHVHWLLDMRSLATAQARAL